MIRSERAVTSGQMSQNTTHRHIIFKMGSQNRQYLKHGAVSPIWDLF